jgi:hypothetical protein
LQFENLKANKAEEKKLNEKLRRRKGRFRFVK